MFPVQSMVLSTFDRKATSPGVESWGHNGLGTALRSFKLADCVVDLILVKKLLASTFPSRLHLHPLPMNLLGLFWCETLATTCGYFSLLDWWGSKQNRKLKAFGFVVDCTAKRSRVSILSSNLIAPLHIKHWRTLLGWICACACAGLRTWGSSRHAVCSPRGCRTSASVHMCTLCLQVAHSIHSAHLCSQRKFVFTVHFCAHDAHLCSMMHTCAHCAFLCTHILFVQCMNYMFLLLHLT